MVQLQATSRALTAGLAIMGFVFVCSAWGADPPASTRIPAKLLASEKTSPEGEVRSVGRLATTGAAYLRMWHKFELGAARPAVNFKERAVLFAASGESGSCPMNYRALRANPPRGMLRIQITDPGNRACTDDWTPRTMVISLRRGDVPEGSLYTRYGRAGPFPVHRVHA